MGIGVVPNLTGSVPGTNPYALSMYTCKMADIPSCIMHDTLYRLLQKDPLSYDSIDLQTVLGELLHARCFLLVHAWV